MGCASKPEVEYRTVYIKPPVDMLSPCPVPVFRGATFGDSVEYALELKRELRICGSKVDAVRVYVESAVGNQKEDR